MRILSIDPATKSLAVSIVDFNENFESDLKEISNLYENMYINTDSSEEKIKVLLARIKALEKLWDNLFILRYANVFDLLPGQVLKGSSTEFKLSRLKGVLRYLKLVNQNVEPSLPFNKVLIERQMSIKNHEISNTLVYAFSKPNHNFTFSGKYLNLLGKNSETSSQEESKDSAVEIIGPALKSKVYFGSAGHMSHFRKKYMSNYTANKAHAKYNFKKWISEHDCEKIIDGISKKNLDDVADSFLMAYAWCIKQYLK